MIVVITWYCQEANQYMLPCYDFWTRNCKDLHWVRLWDFFFKANVRKTLFSSWMRPGGTGKRLSPVQVTGWKGRLRPVKLGGSCQNRGLPAGSHLRRWGSSSPWPRAASRRCPPRRCPPRRPYLRGPGTAASLAPCGCQGNGTGQDWRFREAISALLLKPAPRGEAATGASSQERGRSDKNYPSQHAVPGAGGSTAWWGL